MRRFKYDGLGPHQWTWVYIDEPTDVGYCSIHADRGIWHDGMVCDLPLPDGPGGVCGTTCVRRTVKKAGAIVRINPGDVVEVEDLDDPSSDRARIVRGHLMQDPPPCHEVEVPKKRGHAPQEG